jgi:hypothetical protein
VHIHAAFSIRFHEVARSPIQSGDGVVKTNERHCSPVPLLQKVTHLYPLHRARILLYYDKFVLALNLNSSKYHGGSARKALNA